MNQHNNLRNQTKLILKNLLIISKEIIYFLISDIANQDNYIFKIVFDLIFTKIDYVPDFKYQYNNNSSFDMYVKTLYIQYPQYISKFKITIKNIIKVILKYYKNKHTYYGLSPNYTTKTHAERNGMTI